MLSAIAQGYFNSSSVLFYPIVALLLFLVSFTFITIRVLTSDKESIDATAALPLVDDLAPLSTKTKSGISS
ncbi:MAG: hypothetical protein JKY56_04365 [Kofleriaceae bacterium]|nr:hypothetical protein [Kofleriaceae bacterium]